MVSAETENQVTAFRPEDWAKCNGYIVEAAEIFETLGSVGSCATKWMEQDLIRMNALQPQHDCGHDNGIYDPLVRDESGALWN
jgi:hypothetical protein